MRFFKIFGLILILLIVFAAVDSSFAEEKNWSIKNYQTVRIDRKHKEDHTYLTRLEVPIYYDLYKDWDARLRIEPFTEARYNWEPGDWFRTELGGEIGICLAKIAYVGESIHYAWLKPETDTPELETRLEINIPFVLNSDGYKITVSLLEEYTYATEESKATRNEVAGYLIIPIIEHLNLMTGWRHIDRIHGYDSDQIEATAIFEF